MDDLYQEDFYEASFEVVTEAKEKLPPGVLMRVKGPIGITERKNRNGRLYSNKFWTDILSRDDVQTAITERAMVGAADHPKSFVPPIASVSHVMVNAYLDEKKNALMAEADVLDTPMGRIVKTCFDAKLKLGSSTRGATKTKPRSVSGEMKSEGFKWGGYDFCFEPSAQNAYQAVKEQVKSIIMESSPEALVNESASEEEMVDTRETYKKVLKHFGLDENLVFEKVENERKVCKNCEEKLSFTIKESDLCPTCGMRWDEKIGEDEYKKAFEDLKKAHDGTILELSETQEKLLAVSDSLKKRGSDHNVLNEVKEQLESLQLKFDEASKELEVKEEKVEKLESSIVSLNEQLTSAKESMGVSTAKYLKSIREASELSSKVSELEEKAESLEDSLSEANESLESKERRLKSVQKEAANLKLQTKALRSDLARMDESLGCVRVKYYAMKTGLSEEDITQLGGDEMTLEQVESIIQDIPRKRKRYSEQKLDIKEVVFTEQAQSSKKNKGSGEVVTIINKMRSNFN